MAVNREKYRELIATLGGKALLVAVSKVRTVEEIRELYDMGQRDFGENYVQELLEKQSKLPADIRWHFIGHMQSNKVKHIAPFVYLIQGVDSYKLLEEINRQAQKNNRVIDVLLQVHIAQEETKFGMDESELAVTLETDLSALANIRIRGLMGMATFSDDMAKVRQEMKYLKSLFDRHPLEVLSMGMSGDYTVALEEGSNMVRIGSLLFGNRG
jgi:pyridoxal phosphate enzyme (YggS family)